MNRGKFILSTAGVLVLLGIVLWMGGFVTPGRIQPGHVAAEGRGPAVAETVMASTASIPVVDDAVGTIRPRTEARVSAQVTGRILEIRVSAGEKVRAGQVLARLDDRELRSRVDQAKSRVEAAAAAVNGAREGQIAAEAALTEAESNYNRYQELFGKKSATKAQLETAESGFRQARAGVEQAVQAVSAAKAELARAQESVREAEVGLGFAVINAPEDGEVAERMSEPGDLAWPGKPIVLLHSRGSLRLEASVREGLIGHVPLGATVTVRVTSLQQDMDGVVDEVVPFADPLSRTFMVKVSIPVTSGLFPGMFGRLLVKLGEREAVMAPKRAITRVGQLETVLVDVDGAWTRRTVRTGAAQGDDIEILSGLSGGERLAIVADGVGS